MPRAVAADVLNSIGALYGCAGPGHLCCVREHTKPRVHLGLRSWWIPWYWQEEKRYAFSTRLRGRAAISTKAMHDRHGVHVGCGQRNQNCGSVREDSYDGAAPAAAEAPARCDTVARCRDDLAAARAQLARVPHNHEGIADATTAVRDAEATLDACEAQVAGTKATTDELARLRARRRWNRTRSTPLCGDLVRLGLCYD